MRIITEIGAWFQTNLSAYLSNLFVIRNLVGINISLVHIPITISFFVYHNIKRFGLPVFIWIVPGTKCPGNDIG